MKYSETFFKRFSTFLLSAGIVIFTAACGSSSEEQANQTEMSETESVEQTTTPESNQPTATTQQPNTETAEQTEVDDADTERVVNTKPAITRDSDEYRKMRELREKNRNNEVLAGIAIKYGDWDTDDDNALNEKEFFNGFYSVWDFDNNGAINEEEFNKAAENLFVNYEFVEYGEFSDWDNDGSGEISTDEFFSGMNQVIESDAGQESANRLMTIWDLDNDEKIERIELSNITVLLDADNN